jgi:hypothetical protein
MELSYLQRQYHWESVAIAWQPVFRAALATWSQILWASDAEDAVKESVLPPLRVCGTP